MVILVLRLSNHSSQNKVVIGAFTGFLLVNLVCALFQPAQNQENESVWSREDRLTIEDYNQNVKDPDIVLMGSSMIRTPMWCVDRKTNVTTADYVDYHKAEQFEKRMQEGNSVRRVYDLGADGAYASDLMLMSDKLLVSSKKPKLVVCAISPREFVSAWFVSPRQTPIYKLLSEPSDFIRTGTLFSCDAQDWLEGLLRSVVPLYRHADSYQTCLSNRLQSTPATSSVELSCPMPTVSASTTKSLAEKLKVYESQKRCIYEMVDTAKKRELNLVFVNLPIRGDAKGIYSPIDADYREFLTRLSESNPVLDLESDTVLNQKDSFIDPWHLNQKGGERLVERLVEWLKTPKNNLTCHRE